MQNHVIDPMFFFDAIEQFAFNYEWYPINGVPVLDDLGRRITQYDSKIIRGSLQSQGTQLMQSLDKNTEEMSYNFYCLSLYRINIGDFIKYKNRFLRVEFVQDYDEWGVRSAKLRMVNLNNYHDFKEYLKYINGEKTV